MMSIQKTLLNRFYDCNSQSDVYRDVSEAVDDMVDSIKDQDGLFEGHFKVTIEYIKPGLE